MLGYPENECTRCGGPIVDDSDPWVPVCMCGGTLEPKADPQYGTVWQCKACWRQYARESAAQ